MAALDLSLVYRKNVRFIGHTSSTIDDLQLMLHQTESGQLFPQSIGGSPLAPLMRPGLGTGPFRRPGFPGKVVIFPQIKHFPLTPLADLKEKLPTVYARLKDGREWTVEAEREFLDLMLP